MDTSVLFKKSAATASSHSLPAQSPGVIAAVIRVRLREACSRLPPPLPYTWSLRLMDHIPMCLGVC